MSEVFVIHSPLSCILLTQIVLSMSQTLSIITLIALHYVLNCQITADCQSVWHFLELGHKYGTTIE